MAATLILMTIGLTPGCYDTGPAYLPNGAECGTFEDGTQLSGNVCDGGICLALAPNKQNMAGFCSSDCASDAECTPHDACISVQGQPTYCLRMCVTDDDCFDSFVCRLPNPGAKHMVCLVDATF